MLGDVRNATTATDYATIQDAINAATAGDVIEVVAGNHSEGPVVVDRDLTLRGATGTEVVRPTMDTGSYGDARGWFLVNAGVDLTVRDLTFDGTGFLVYQAFRHKGSGAFEDTGFRNIRYNESGPTYAGTAIAAFGNGVVDVRRCGFQGIGRQGIFYFGAGVSGSTAEDNVYTGKGSGDFLDYGIEVGAGAVVTLARNVVSGNRGVASSDGSDSAAVLLTTFFGPGTQATLESNQILDSTIGVAHGYDSSDTTVVDAAFNRIVGNDTGLINTSASVTTQAENNWWGCNGGPGAAGCDTVSGMTDVDPWLVLRLLPPVGNVAPVDLVADLTQNSDGADVSGLGSFPDGVGVTFTTTNGTVTPAVPVTSNGTATTSLDTVGGPATVTATLDNQTVELMLDLDFLLAVPTLSPLALALFLVLLTLAGLVALRRRAGVG
jgi:hypothetical protein